MSSGLDAQVVDRPVVLFVGNYGSGKTEVAVNFSIAMADLGLRVRLADLDLVNPYFRSREAKQVLERHGVHVVLPPPELMHADLPILAPEVKGMLQRPDGLAVLDVGGDDVGATVLSSLANAFEEGGYELLQVVNGNRPFTDTADGVLQIMDEIERAARLHVTALVSNAHLMEETTVETIIEGYALTREVAQRRGLPIRFVTAPAELADAIDPAQVDNLPVLAIHRQLLPPWRRSEDLGSRQFSLVGKV